MGNEKTLGQIAFEAYGENRDWTDWRGEKIKTPAWSEVGQHIRDTWEGAAHAVAVELGHGVDEKLPLKTQ